MPASVRLSTCLYKLTVVVLSFSRLDNQITLSFARMRKYVNISKDKNYTILCV